MSAIELTGAEAVHPGYGFLSENYEFSKILEENKIKFIGPSSEHIKMMGDKIQAKKIAKKNGLPIIEGSEGGISDKDEAKKISEKIGYPVLIKAAGGGGGKGMKIVNKSEEFENLFLTAKSEAKKYFGNDEVYIEKFFQNPRHIEVQILSGKNRTVHLHERDCSVQRRHQKLIEETPSPVLDEKLRKDLFERTVNMVQKIGYEGAGTVEFIYDAGFEETVNIYIGGDAGFDRCEGGRTCDTPRNTFDLVRTRSVDESTVRPVQSVDVPVVAVATPPQRPGTGHPVRPRHGYKGGVGDGGGENGSFPRGVLPKNARRTVTVLAVHVSSTHRKESRTPASIYATATVWWVPSGRTPK